MIRPAPFLAAAVLLWAAAVRGDGPYPRIEAKVVAGKYPSDSIIYTGFGLRGAFGRTRDSAGGETMGSVLAHYRTLAYFTLRGISTRYRHLLAIGGGSGLDGVAAVDVGLGYRLDLGERHGPVARAGLEAFVHSTPLFRSSLVQLPRGELGYQYLGRMLHLEAAFVAGPALGGRFGVGDRGRARLGEGIGYGGYAAASMHSVSLTVDWTRVGDSRTEIVDGELCGLPTLGGAFCFDLRRQRSAELPGEEVVYGGLSVVLGQTERR